MRIGTLTRGESLSSSSKSGSVLVWNGDVVLAVGEISPGEAPVNPCGAASGRGAEVGPRCSRFEISIGTSPLVIRMFGRIGGGEGEWGGN